MYIYILDLCTQVQSNADRTIKFVHRQRFDTNFSSNSQFMQLFQVMSIKPSNLVEWTPLISSDFPFKFSAFY